MRLPKRDIIASGLVGVAAVLYVVWAVGSAPPGMSGTRVTGIVILSLGFAASANAVVPGFAELLHGSRAYLAATTLIGLVAFAAGVRMLFAGSETALGVVMVAMLVLWLIATIHHRVDVRDADQRPARHSQLARHEP